MAHTDGSYEDVKRPVLGICGAAEVDELDVSLAIQNNVLVLDVSVHDEGLCMQMVDCLGHLAKDAAALVLGHVHTELDVVEEIHAR